MLDPKMMQLFRLQAEICKTLADPNRLMLLHEIREGEKSVGQLVSYSNLPQSNVSRHLGVLREHGIILPRREGTTIYYRLANPRIGEACDMVRKVLEMQLAENRELASSLSDFEKISDNGFDISNS